MEVEAWAACRYQATAHCPPCCECARARRQSAHHEVQQRDQGDHRHPHLHVL